MNMKKINRLKIHFLRTINIRNHIDIQAAICNIRDNIYFRGPNIWILAFSIVIASVGLNVNSIPVIIGAMLISPLMGPIFGIGLGMGINDTKLIKDSLKNLGVMFAISLVASFLYFLVSPLNLDNPTELMARTNPTIYDVIIALFGGFAGIFEITRKAKGTVFAGVAIATALMPPLCTAGFGLASGNIMYFIGALYLFFINCAFITLATYFIVRYLRFPSVKFSDPKNKAKTKRYISIAVVVLIIPSVWSAIMVIRQNNFDSAAKDFIEHNKILTSNYIFNSEISHHKGSTLTLYIGGSPLTTTEKDKLYESAASYGIERGQLVINESTARQEGMGSEEIIEGFYNITNNEIQKREELIRNLEEQLRNFSEDKIDYSQTAREIMAQMPGITGISIAKGADLNMQDCSHTDAVFVILETESSDKTDIERLTKWLKVRLNSENVKIIIRGNK